MPMGTGNSARALASADRILLVDDEEPFRFAALLALRRGGYRAEGAPDGALALRMVLAARDSGDPYRLVITDIRMQGMSGIELIEALNREKAGVEVCAITSFGDKELLDELAAHGCAAHIEKPFSPKGLLSRVSELLEPEG